jgi:hypothetical protein
MLGRWFRLLIGRGGPRAAIASRGTVYYFEHGRKLTTEGETLIDGFEINVASIIGWDDGDRERIDESERQRILKNVISSLESQGLRVVLE